MRSYTTILGITLALLAWSEGDAGTAASDLAPSLPMSSDSFVDAIGVDTHFNYPGTPYVEAWPAISAALIGSGIRHIRDATVHDRTADTERFRYLGLHGIRHSLSFEVYDSPDDVRAALQRNSPYVDFIEAANEYDAQAQKDPLWAEHLVHEQQIMYDTVHSAEGSSTVRVLGPALEQQHLYGALGNLDAIEDGGNLHDATCNRNPGTDNDLGIVAMTALVRKSTPSKPIWTTETGYGDDPNVTCALPDAIIAKYDPRTIAERFNAGEPRIYLYQFCDMPSDPLFGRMGIVRADGSAKAPYDALRSLITTLSDPGPPFHLVPLRYRIETSGHDVHHTLLQKRNGVYELLLWRELPSWNSISADNVDGVPVAVPATEVTVESAQARASRYLTYDSNWYLTPAHFRRISGNRERVTVTDAISVLELR